MKQKVISNFTETFGIEISLNPNFVVEKAGRYYLVNSTLKSMVKPEYYYAGTYLGKAKGGKFFPSFNLLSIMAKKDVSRVIVDWKTAWLFICGRDILLRGVLRFFGSGKKHTNVLVLNEFGECLGFGRIVGNMSDRSRLDDFVVRNVSDVGDFLRRER